MQSTRGKTWRHGLFDGPSGRTEREGRVLASDADAPDPRVQAGQRVWAFLCPNPTCDTELVVFPEYAGSTVECPSCGFAFLAPRVVPLQITSDAETADGPAPPRPFAPGAVMARPSAPPAPPRPKDRKARRRGAAAPPGRPAAGTGRPAETKPPIPPAEAAAQIARSPGDGTKALEALARSVGDAARPPAVPPPAPADAAKGSTASAEAAPAEAGPPRAPSEALQALASAAGEAGAEGRRKRSGRGPKGAGLAGQLASAAFEGERRRSTRMQMAGDSAAARKAMDRSAARTPPASGPLPLSEGERRAARRQRTDLVVTWAVAAVVSAGLTLAAYVTGVPDIGLGSLLFLGLAGARTWWVTRGKDAAGPPGA
jgi:hypothetical protein